MREIGDRRTAIPDFRAAARDPWENRNSEPRPIAGETPSFGGAARSFPVRFADVRGIRRLSEVTRKRSWENRNSKPRPIAGETPSFSGTARSFPARFADVRGARSAYVLSTKQGTLLRPLFCW